MKTLISRIQKIHSYIFLLIFSLSASVEGSAPVFHFELADVVDQTLAHSPRFQASQFDYESARYRSRSLLAPLFPRLSFDASVRLQSEVPVFRPVPNGPVTQFGSHKNYSYGPTLSWLLVDSGGSYSRWKVSDMGVEQKYYEMDVLKRQLTLEARLTYFQVQLALEQVRALSQAAALAEQQFDDISRQQKAGMLSRIDTLSAHQVLLSRRRELRAAQTDLAHALRDLMALMSVKVNIDPSLPFVYGPNIKSPSALETPTVYVDVDSTEKTFSSLKSVMSQEFGQNHPQLMALHQTIMMAKKMAESLSSQQGPTAFLTAKTSIDYPNGPVLESIHQNSVGVVASIPIFEFKRVTNETKAQEAVAQMSEERQKQTMLNMERDWHKAQDEVASLTVVKEINAVLSRGTRTCDLGVCLLQGGAFTYLEVENANYKQLLSDVQMAKTDVQHLMQLAILDSLSQK